VRDFNCPRNLLKLSKEYFNRTAVMTSNNSTIERRMTKGCPQGSCCGPGIWNLLYNSLTLELTSRSKAIAFPDDLIILTRGEIAAEAENYMNLELRKLQDSSQNNKLKFKENNSKVMLMSRRKRKRKKNEIEIYVNKTLKFTFREHVTYIEKKLHETYIFTCEISEANVGFET
jgi:hypothetical protein